MAQPSEQPRATEHTPAAVRRRLIAPPRASYLRDFVYGAIDGAVTTFAVVAGVEGADLSANIVIILGIANLVADGFSMAASNYLGTRAEDQQREQARHEEQRQIELVPEGEREEIRQLYAAKGFHGRRPRAGRRHHHVRPRRLARDDDARGTRVRKRRDEPAACRRSTLVAFIVVGFLPLGAFVYDFALPGDVASPFTWSAVLTGIRLPRRRRLEGAGRRPARVAVGA